MIWIVPPSIHAHSGPLSGPALPSPWWPEAWRFSGTQ